MQKNRIAYIDQIKVFLTCLVVAHHAAQAYGPTGGVWVISDKAKASWLQDFFFINASYMMGLYFFISGYFMVFSIRRKTKYQFVKDRLKRLGIPLLFFTFLVFLPFNYFLSGSKENLFLFFADTYINKPPLATGHLWFVASLLAYSFIYLILFGKHFSASTDKAVPFRTYYILIYILLLTLATAVVRLKYPIDQWKTWGIPVEVAHLPQYLSLFLIGTVFNRLGWLNDIKLKTGIFFLLIAIVTYTSQYWLPHSISGHWLAEPLAESLLCVGISLGVIVLFRHYGNKMNFASRLLSENAYGIYLFHLIIVIMLQKMILSWNAAAEIKFLTVTILAIIFSLLLSHFLRKIKTLRNII